MRNKAAKARDRLETGVVDKVKDGLMRWAEDRGKRNEVSGAKRRKLRVKGKDKVR